MSDESEQAIEHRRKVRGAKLDAAFEEYVRDMVNTGDMPPGILSGWVAGISVVHFDPSGSDTDGILTESTPNMNSFLARGVADATAERFGQVASGFFEMEAEDGT